MTGVSGMGRMALVALGAAAATSACGSGGASRSATVTVTASQSAAAKQAATATGTFSTSASATQSTNGEAARAPSRILADAVAALREVQGYELDGDVTEGRRHMRIKLISDSRNALEVAVAIDNTAIEVLRLPSALYMRGNAAFWRPHLGTRANLLAGRWIQTPAASGASLLGSLREFEPGILARCLTEDHGTLSHAGTTTINGQPAVVIRDAGNLPGTQPTTIAVAASGPPYPLRLTAVGNGKPGGRVDVCNSGKANSYRGSITLSSFGRVAPIAAPLDVLRIPSAPTA